MSSAGTAHPTPTAYHHDALKDLHDRGAEFVRCRADKRPLEWRGYQHRTLPLDHALTHVQDGGLLGVHPASLGSAVLDVDRGDPSLIIDLWHPTLSAPTRREGGCHIWYPFAQGQVYRDSPFDAGGVSGDVKYKGYVCLWHDAAARLAEALDRGADLDATPFEVVAEQMGLWSPEVLDEVAPRRVAMPSVVPGDESYRVGIGNRNQWIFARLCAAAGRDPALRVEPLRLYALAGELNARRCDPPLDDREVRAIVSHAAGYAAMWASDGHSADFLNRQAERGRRSGEKRRERTIDRDGAIVAAHAGGMSVRGIANLYGVPRSTVGRVIRESSPPPP